MKHRKVLLREAKEKHAGLVSELRNYRSEQYSLRRLRCAVHSEGDQGAVELNWLEAALGTVDEQYKTAILLMHIHSGNRRF